MNREIKYRVKTMWCGEVRVAPVSSIDDFDTTHGYCYIELSSYSSDRHGWDTHCGDVLMQYTGLKDKNAVEIYEGDIVAFEEVRSYKGVIKFQKGMFFIEWESHCYIRNDLWHFFEQMDRFEVIGNIYENPELLEDINEQGND